MTEEQLLQPKTFRDTVSTVTKTGKRNWVYALKPKGKWYNIRSILAYLYVVAFFAMPFIKVNGMPFFMLNVLEGKFIIFGNIFWPNDFFIFAVGTITFIIFIVIFTVAYGRLFCGWACPQTIFMEFIFRKIEWLIEGNPNKQKALNNGAKNANYYFKKTFKHIVFFALSFFIANTFLSYILSLDEVLRIVHEPIEDHILLLSGLLVFTGLFYVVYAFVREIVCTTICPYGRLQSVMFDKNTMQISYDYSRGEPRHKLVKETNSFGDCIDCGKCVVVCPTGIDIRNGIQMECVGCTACIDACNEVMAKIHKPLGLIRYASENEISLKQPFVFTRRLKAYTVLLAILLGGMLTLIFTRNNIDTLITRARGQLYQEQPNNMISNLYEAKIINKTNKEQAVQLKVEGVDAQVVLIGKTDIHLKKEAINDITFFVHLPKKSLTKRSSTIKIAVIQGGKKIQTINTKFLGPFI